MQYLLIAAALNLQVVYTDLHTCNKASESIQKAGYEALCIPKGENHKFTEQSSQIDMMFDKFLNMVKELQKLEQKETN